MVSKDFSVELDLGNALVRPDACARLYDFGCLKGPDREVFACAKGGDPNFLHYHRIGEPEVDLPSR